MSLNPLNELKRRLNNTDILLPKRLCLAKNVIQSHHFPSAPKERVIADWLQELNENKILKGEELKNILDWLNICDDLTSELKIKLIQIVSQYIQTNPIQDNEIQTLVSFIENDKIKLQLNSLIDDYLAIIITLLQNIKNKVEQKLPERIFNNIIKYYRESKKKLEFIIKLLNGENIETIFSYLDTEYRNTVINVCQNILFPLNKRTYFISFLQTLIRKDNLDELIAEKGDNIQSVLKIMDALFAFPKGRTDMSVDFIKHFIDVFVSCFHTESQIVFAFYIMVANFLDLQQNYITPAMNLPTVQLVIEKVDKCQRLLFLNMLEILLTNEVDISIRLTDTFGEKIPKVEIKKTFILFLQAVMMNQLKLEDKADKTTIEIVKTALKLDPTLIEQKMIQIVPSLMISKKNSTKILESYTDMLTCLLATLFKLGRGILFINQILPNVKLSLESCNTEQFELKQTLLEDESNEKIRNKIITGNDIFPRECVEVYGKLTSELMFRQNKELLVSLQKDLEVYCLMMLEEGFVSSSIITLTEVLSAILSSFLCNSKMADHTVPLPIAEDFWNVFKTFEEKCIKKFGECILNLSYNPRLVTSFLKLCLSVAQMKLLNIKYSNVKIGMTVIDTTEIFDMSSILPCLTSEQWMGLASNIKQDETVMLMDNLILVKRSITELLALTHVDTISNLDFTTTNAYFIRRIAANPEILDNTLISRTLFSHIDGKQCKELVKTLINVYMSNPEQNIFKSDVLKNNRLLQNCLTIEVTRNISKCFDNCDLLSKKLSKVDFEITEFAKENDMKELFANLKIKPDIQDVTIKNYINILTELQIPYLDKNYQLVVIFLILSIKKCCLSKKIKKNINKILQSIYELSSLPPSLYQIFPTDYIFDFETRTILNLVTLKKTSYDLLIVKTLLEIAVKRVKVESELVTSVVELLLQKNYKNSNTMDVFNDAVFQISCTILPLLVKQKQLITASVHRSILADLQDKLQKELLESFKNIDFTQISSLKDNTGNINESLVDSDNIATLNAMAAYALTLSRYCETTDGEETKNLDYLWSGLEFFVYNAINSLNNPSSKQQYIESSVQLLNTILRYIKKLETHEIFKQKDVTFNKIWECLKTRLMLINEESGRCWNKVLDDTAVALKFLFELSSVEWFSSRFVGDIGVLSVLKKPNEILKDEKKTDEIKHKVAKFLIIQCLKANIIGPKCVAMSKLTYKNCRNLNFWIRQHYDEDSVASKRKRKFNIYAEDGNDEKKIIKIDDSICDLIRTDLETLSEVILAAKKITLDYKYLDTIFELQHMINHIMGLSNARLKCEISSNSYFLLYEGCILILNSLIVSREEMLEDRWPCFMQCYRALVSSLCERSNSQIEIERSTEEKLAVIAHSIEKLTQSISKRKKHVSRISAYTVADMCALIEKSPPVRNVRQHLENSISLLIQACDSSYAMPFLKRALAGAAGQATVANMYLNYKRYYKYTGNA